MAVVEHIRVRQRRSQELLLHQHRRESCAVEHVSTDRFDCFAIQSVSSISASNQPFEQSTAAADLCHAHSLSARRHHHTRAAAAHPHRLDARVVSCGEKRSEAAFASQCVLLHRKSGWVNEDQMVAILKLSGHRLRPHMAQPQPDLVMVALAPPFAGRVLRAAGTAGRWVVVVPAHITLLLQPADTHPLFLNTQLACGSNTRS